MKQNFFFAKHEADKTFCRAASVLDYFQKMMLTLVFQQKLISHFMYSRLSKLEGCGNRFSRVQPTKQR